MICPGAAAVSLDGLPVGIKGFRSVNFIYQAEPNASFHPLFEGFQHAIRPYRTFHPIHCLGFSRLFSPAEHFHGFVFALYRHLASTFLRPFAPQPLRRFFAIMDALTPVRRVLRILIRDNERPSLTGQVSPVHPARPSMHPVTKHPTRALSSLLCCSPSVLLASRFFKIGSGLRLESAGSSLRKAESCSSSYGLLVCFRLLSTPPRGDAVTFSYRG